MAQDNIRIILVDDRLGFWGTAKFLEYRLNNLPDRDYKFQISHERYITKLEERLKTEPFDLILLDLVFEHNKKEEGLLRKLMGNNDPAPLKNAGKWMLQHVIRPNFPALPVVVFTSKEQKEKALLKATEFFIKGNAAFFIKERLNEDGGYEELRNIIIELHKQYTDGFKDKIETDDCRREEELQARNRDYMQTRMWQILAEKIQGKCRDTKYNDSFAVVFFDVDGMRRLNELYGYHGTNRFLVKFVKEVSKKIKNKDKEECILGRYFRERGDEFLICWPQIDKEEVLKEVEELRKHIQNESSRWLKDALDIKNEVFLEVTASFGVFVYPDDLDWELWKQHSRLSRLCVSQRKEFAEKAYGQMTRVAQQLKDSAKLLGRNQVCYYRCREGQDDKGYSPRVNVLMLIDENGGCRKIKQLFHFIFGDLAFDFITARGNWRPIHALAKVKQGKLQFHATDKHGNPLSGKQYVYPDGGGIAIRSFFDEYERYYEKLLNRGEMRKEALKTHAFMRDIYVGLFHVLRRLAREHYGYERHFPRFSIQNEIFKSFERLKEEIIFYKDKQSQNPNDLQSPPVNPNSDFEKLGQYFKGVNIPQPQSIWVSERLGNRESEKKGSRAEEAKRPYKHSLMLPLEVKPIAYRFLTMESARNMVKFQHFIEGYFKGFLAMKPDGEMAEHVIDLIYWNDMARRNKEKKKRIILCRHSLFTPVDPVVYNELVEIDRIRLDLKLPEKEKLFGKGDIGPVQHIKLGEAKENSMIGQGSVVDKFAKKWFNGGSGLTLVIYAGSEMIGPSVQLAEVAGYLTEELLKNSDGAFVLFDMFSGSSATCLPSLERLCRVINGPNLTSAYIIRMDQTVPELDYLNEWFEHQSNKPKNIHFAKENYYIKAEFDFEKSFVRTEGGSLCFRQFLDSCVLKKIDAREEKCIDITIADPPHILSVPFLFKPDKCGLCFAKALSEKTKVFVVYYAHKEQVELCKYIRENLKCYFDSVWQVTVAGEEMAVCCNEEAKKAVENALSNARSNIQKDYYNDMAVVDIREI